MHPTPNIQVMLHLLNKGINIDVAWLVTSITTEETT